ncbi:MFS transporter [Sinimarinibacterium thermocellulolyticum]|uniref:MFS transporter n=1 Tax=Sinimarinibacterium thermocellulolyticum TaxID=3170016 RepID=A0ABV2A9M1_9GAMM
MSATPSSPAWRVVVAAGAGQLLAWGSSYYLLAILARPMAADMDLAPLWVYASFSGALLVAAMLGPFAGARIDRHGGRCVLLASNALFALALIVLALAEDRWSLLLGWLLMGAAMPMGLYDAAFSTMVGLYGARARRAIVGITLIAGFASTISWPLTAAIEAEAGWRAACVVWAVLHLTVGAGIHAWLLPPSPPMSAHPAVAAAAAGDGVGVPPPRTLWLLALVFTASGFVFAAMATHLPRLLELGGCSPAQAVAAASLVGIAQVVGRVVEAGWLSRLHPLATARLSSVLHPLGAMLFALFGGPLAFTFAALHGAGVGIMTIVKGTLPLALFGTTGFGRRAGLLEAPARLAQATAPMLFGVALDHWGAAALWLSIAAGAIAVAGVLGLRTRA